MKNAPVIQEYNEKTRNIFKAEVTALKYKKYARNAGTLFTFMGVWAFMAYILAKLTATAWWSTEFFLSFIVLITLFGATAWCGMMYWVYKVSAWWMNR